jgi:transposase-like protein
VAYQDRLSRENGRATAEVWEALNDAGARLVCAAEGLDTATGDHEMLFTIKAAIAREQWKRYRGNSARSQRSAHERSIPNGQPPLGYRKNKDKRLEIDRRAAAKVQEIAERRIAGDSLSSIARRFGLAHSTVRQKRTLRCGDMVGENAHSSILTREQFDALQASRTKQAIPPGGTTRDRLLLGFVYCQGCGHTLKVVRRSRVDGSHVSSYFCKDAASEPCSERAFVHADDLDEFVSDWFESALRETPRMVDGPLRLLCRSCNSRRGSRTLAG